MNLSPSDIDKLGFRISKEGDLLNEAMMKRLGLEFRYGPARLAIAYAISERKIESPTGSSNQRIIKGASLFGNSNDIQCWTILIKAAFQDADLATSKGYQQTVNALWDTGIRLLDKLWTQLGENRAEFIKHLAENAGLNTSGQTTAQSTTAQVTAIEKIYSDKQVSITIGGISENIKTGEKITWEVNKDGNTPVLAFMGTMGTGKTETAFQVIEQIKKQSDASFLVFDIKGDLSDANRQSQTGAQVIKCSKDTIPVDAFTPLDKSENKINTAAQEFRDTFIQVPKSTMGANQKRMPRGSKAGDAKIVPGYTAQKNKPWMTSMKKRT